MRKTMISLLAFCFVMVCANAKAQTRAQRPDDYRATGVAKLEGRLQQDLKGGDATRIARNFSELYSDAGTSREEAMGKFKAMFAKAENAASNVKVADFKQFPGTGIATARILIQVTSKGDSGAPTVIQETVGVANLIQEGGEWKIFGINAFADNQLREGNQLFACPATPEGFSFDAENGDWQAWPAARVYSAAYHHSTQGPTFDKEDWAKRVIEAWNTRSPKLVADYLSPKYVHLGFAKEGVVRQAADLFSKYSQISLRYRVLDFKYLNSRHNLVAYKAVMEMKGIPSGGTQFVKVLETLGYGSVVYENGKWRQYSSQFYR